MTYPTNEMIQTLEERLKNAMLESNTAELDNLLADDLIFTSHLGQTMGKQDDIKAHSSGFVKIEKIYTTNQQIKLYYTFAVVSVQTEILGTFGGDRAEIVLQFTRIWHSDNDGWQVIAAHSSIAS